MPSIHSTVASVSRDRPLGDEVVDVGRPVLDGRVADARAGLGDELDHRGVQRVGGVHRRRAALDVVHRRTLVGDDQRALELARVLGVDAEVRLQRHVDVHAGRHVDERAPRPHRRVERGELVVTGRDDGAEVLPHQLRVLAQGDVHGGEQDPLLLQVFAVLVVHDLGFELRGDPGEVLALGFGDAQLLVGLLHALGEHVPVGDLTLGGLEVVVDVVEVDVGHVGGEPLEHRLALEALQRVEPELRHPLRLVLLPGDVAHDGLVEALLGRVDVVVGAVVPPELVLAEIDPGNGHAGTPYWGSPQGFAGISTTRHSNNPGADPQPGPDRAAAGRS